MRMTLAAESWPIAGSFTISRGTKTAADVVVVTLERDGHVGRGECVPYPRYRESVPGVLAGQYEDFLTSSFFSNPLYYGFRQPLEDQLENQIGRVVIWLGGNVDNIVPR